MSVKQILRSAQNDKRRTQNGSFKGKRFQLTLRTRGFVLVELLVALTLLSLAGTGMWLGFMQCLHAQQRIESNHRSQDPVRIFFLRLEKDLRNAVYLKDHKFHGNKESISFPVLQQGEGGRKLLKVSYYKKNQSVVRSVQRLSSQLVKEHPKEVVLIDSVSRFEFAFPYANADERVEYQGFWFEEPYFGIPRSVEIKITGNANAFDKLVSIPQGKWGHLPEGAK